MDDVEEVWEVEDVPATRYQSSGTFVPFGLPFDANEFRPNRIANEAVPQKHERDEREQDPPTNSFFVSNRLINHPVTAQRNSDMNDNNQHGQWMKSLGIELR